MFISVQLRLNSFLEFPRHSFRNVFLTRVSSYFKARSIVKLFENKFSGFDPLDILGNNHVLARSC